MKVLFGDFFRDLLNSGRVVAGSDLMPVLREFCYQLPVAACHFDKVGALLDAQYGDIIEHNDARFSLLGDHLVSDKPFNVTGFTGCMDEFVSDFKDCIADDVRLVKESIDAWGRVSFGVSRSSNRDFPVAIYEIAERFCSHWVKKAYDYVKSYSDYNLVGDNFPDPGISELIASLFGIRNFYERFKKPDDLDKLVDILDFRKMLGWLEREFDEGKLNAEFLEKAASELCRPYVHKKSYKAHDVYKVRYYPGWVDNYYTLSGGEINDWLNAFRAMCIDQDLRGFWSEFGEGFNGCICRVAPGQSVVSGGCNVRVFKENISVSLPKSISVAMGVFINKYNPDALRKMVA